MPHRSLRSPAFRPRSACVQLALALAVALVAAPARGQIVLPAHFEALTLPGNYNLAVNLEFAPDGTLFIVQKTGQVRVVKANGTTQTQNFIDLSAEVNNDHDRGLLGFALHPGFVPDLGPTSWVYLLYTVSPIPGQDLNFDENDMYSFSRLTRYRARTLASGAIVAELPTREVLIGHQNADGTVPDGIASLHHSHSNGALVFGADGSLLLAAGDGAHYDYPDFGGHDDPGFDDFIHPDTLLHGPMPAVQDSGAFRAQDVRSLSGKVLRVDPETGFGYPSNPFHDGHAASLASRIWALGLRNPFRMALVPGTGASDPSLAQPGTLIVGDVGLNKREELDRCTGGENFGWPCFEAVDSLTAYQAFDPPQPQFPNCNGPLTGTLTGPLLTWHHSTITEVLPPGVYVDGAGNPLPGFEGSCTIAGAFYTGSSFPAEYAGRLFTADYEDGWIKTVELDGAQQVVAVQDFASNAGAVVDLAVHPVSGELWFCDVVTAKVQRIRYGSNLTPVAVAQADPVAGSAPLQVQFTGSGSTDPEGDPLTFDWDFGDGTPHSDVPDPQHVYAANGLYAATLRVTDPGEISGTSPPIAITVATVPLSVQVTAPVQGHLFTVPETVPLQAAVTGGTAPLTWQWTVDQYHDTHVHPGIFVSSETAPDFVIENPGEEGEPIYYRIELSVTDDEGAVVSDHVFVLPAVAVREAHGTAQILSKLDELSPPWSLGDGNIDPEIVRDAKLPAVGSGDVQQQYATLHNGAQGSDDWIGYALPAAPDDAVRFVSLQFQEGLHFEFGGWWKDFHVEARQAGAWVPAQNLTVTPAYPFALAQQPFFDGVGFQTYELAFDPIGGDAVRLRGSPGGNAHYITCGELRARVFDPDIAPIPHADITAAGTVVAKVFSLSPPVPQGQGNKDPQTISNGTAPPPGSLSVLAQYDTYHNGDQGNEDWIGYDFGATRTFSRVQFAEGRHFPDGGAFISLGAQVQRQPGGPWTAVPGLAVTPPYAGLNAIGYETFVLEFPPLTGRAIRIAGPPAGLRKYISVAELTVYEPLLAEGCGWQPYGENLGGANTLTLSSLTPPALGLPIEVNVSGAAQHTSGMLGFSLGSAQLPFQGGTLLIDPVTLFLIPFTYNAQGDFALPAVLPAGPELAGLEIWFQAFALAQPVAPPLRMSNGLKLKLCEW